MAAARRDNSARALAACRGGRRAGPLQQRALRSRAASRSAPDPLQSLAYSTRASFLRQLGWHDLARAWDGRAAAIAGSDREAGADAMIGLAADALGVGRFAASQRALRRAADLLDASVPARLHVRIAWVSAELAMARVRARRRSNMPIEPWPLPRLSVRHDTA